MHYAPWSKINRIAIIKPITREEKVVNEDNVDHTAAYIVRPQAD